MKFSIKDFFGKYDQIRSFQVTFTEEILNGKLHFSCSDIKFKTNKNILHDSIEDFLDELQQKLIVTPNHPANGNVDV